MYIIYKTHMLPLWYYQYVLIEIGFIYIDLNIYKSLSNEARESNIAISNHRDKKKTGSMVKESRKGVKVQETAEARAWDRSL